VDRLGRSAAWAVHAYTALGAACAFLALLATLERHYTHAFAWLALQVFIDATDGWLARLVRVGERTPQFSGAHLDDIVDYLTYVFVPAVMVWHGPLVPESWRIAVPLAMLVSSAFGFSRLDAKTDDHYFTGFPSYWNVVVFYLVAWRTDPGSAAALLLTLAALVFVPLRYVYPSRTVPFMRPTLVLGAIWAALMLLTLARMPDVPAWLLAAGLVFPLYYVALSLWLDIRRRRAQDGARPIGDSRSPMDRQ
jgi:phosphatidylcholine synthase